MAFQALPVGAFDGRYDGRGWRVARTPVAGGRGWKLQAWEKGGNGYVSLNVYDLTGGSVLRPCEMSRDRVVAFVLGFCPDGASRD